MHLASIRLSGFKSFVDSTTVRLPGQLIGVVGPNGCGKSNIIDAVRWVLGESSAKSLRGGQISDVIFNGSSTRPAASQASIELNFENAQGQLKGDFAKYNEISISRQVNSEGISIYYINKIRCRRKDIVDTFLGTGLGARSYSIIQQGTISRLVEAKPDELRQYLEEAAGISHYKERRRETEARMQATRANLERLEDICSELEKHLRTLSIQAKNAQTYKELKQKRTKLNHELLALQWRELNKTIERLEIRNETTANRIEAQLTNLRKIEATQEQQTQKKYQLQTEYDQAQQTYYSAKESIARTQEQIQSHEQRQEDMEQEVLDMEKRKSQLLSQQASDQAEINDLKRCISAREKTLAEDNKRLGAKQSEYINAEKDHMALQQEWDKFQSQSYEQRQQSELDQYKVQQLEQKIIQTRKQIEQLSDHIADDLTRLNKQHKQQLKENNHLSEYIKQQQISLEQTITQLKKAQGQEQEQQQKMHLLQRQLQVTEGTLASLTTLLERKTETANSEMLKNLRSKYDLKPWIDSVKVKPGWEQAIETTVPELIAMEISSTSDLIQNNYTDIDRATASIIIDRDNGDEQAPSGLYSCKEIIDGPVPAWLQSVFFSEDCHQALQHIHQLLPHQRIVCKTGTSMGSNWIMTSQQSDDDALLVINQQLRDKQITQQHLSEQIQEHQMLMKEHQKHTQECKQQSEEKQQQLHELQQRQVADKAALQHLLHKIDSLHKEQEKNIAHKKELTRTHAESEQQLKQMREIWSKRLNTIQYDDQKRQELSDRRNFLQKQRSQAQKGFNELQNQVGELRLQLQQDISQQEYLNRNLQRLEHDTNEIDSRLDKIAAQQQQIAGQPDKLHKELQKLLDQQLKQKEQMQQRHSAVNQQEQEIKNTGEQHRAMTSGIEELNARTQDFQIKRTELATRQQTIDEQLQGEDPKAIAEDLPEEAEAASWKNRIQSADQKIHLLGEVNHAAIKDYQSETERKQHLDQQRSEIEKALTTLANTISTIDKATKDTFSETFEQVNTNLQKLFPQLLGGGMVKLEMTSNDLLTTGVKIIARPPGKRNTSISMLSGGEKAMTAIALVFAIFQLNPAPFCMLDEVDAPLDDVNTFRYISTVKAMTEKVQFILVTHSKITMEHLDQLIGVTMSEAGVSRTVSVDINKVLA